MTKIPGRPLEDPSEITDKRLLDQAITSLIYGPDENADTRARGWYHVPDEGGLEDRPVQWYQWNEDLQHIDNVISEAIETDPTILPSTNLLDQIETVLENLDEWFSAGIPIWHKRHGRYIIDEMGEIANALRSGQMDSGTAQARFNVAMQDLHELVDFSRFME